MISTKQAGKPQSSQADLLLCFSHLRWDFVTQRPQHLMTRIAREYRVIVWEEPHYLEGASPRVDMRFDDNTGVTVAVPTLPSPDDWVTNQVLLKGLLDDLIATQGAPVVRWYYSPMLLAFSRHLSVEATVYDCMDELANFKDAPRSLLPLERELLTVADVVFTGGHSLYEAKRAQHDNVHPFPSSVDTVHFARARRSVRAEGAPVLGFYGVIDERIDLDLVRSLAQARPDWTIEMVGPTAKIEDATLPQLPNIRYLGAVDYTALPETVARWDVALMPFAINDATRFISPTKTPEYLAAGKPVVSTAIVDVVRHYADLDGVFIADDTDGFVRACEDALALPASGRWLEAVDAMLAASSWDKTANAMAALVDKARAERRAARKAGGGFAPDERFDVLVVGAGFAGSVMAERLAEDAGLRVLVVDRRPHIAGNAYDRPDAAGVMIHRYGPHIFHTNSDEIAAYLSRFTAWRPYEHRVLAEVDGMRVPMPINRTTLNMLYGLDLQTDDDAAEYLASRAEPVARIETSEDVVVAAIGRDLYQKFFRGYTRKQWDLDPSQLNKSVTSRVPTRTNVDDRYFTDSFQSMPLDGYTAMFERILDHPNITVRMCTDYVDVRDKVSFDRLVFTGPIDEYFGHRFGKLPYRSLNFRHETHDVEELLPVGTVNYPSQDVPYTRVSEFKKISGQVHPKTSVCYEYPTADGDPYYPIPRDENQALFKQYEALADAEENVTFVGRLATYRYYNMDQVVGQALATYRRLKEAGLAKPAKAAAEVMAA